MDQTGIFLILLLSIAYSRGFLTCADQPFCNNIRDKENPQNHFILLYFQQTAEEHEFTANLFDFENDKTFDLKITSLKNDMFRIRVTDPNRRRYDMDDALVAVPSKAAAKMTKIQRAKATIQIINGLTQLNIQEEAFTIDVLHNGKLIQQLNSKGRMEFISDDNNQGMAMDIIFQDVQRAYGLPEHADGLALVDTGINVGEPYRLYNMDYPAYGTGSRDALYGSIPVLYGIGSTGSSGVLWLTASQTLVDIQSANSNVESLFISESGVMDIFILPGPELKDSVRRYSELTGTANLPPYFSLGYHQSRWSYMSQEDVETVVAEMDNHDFPLDVMWLDIDYADSIKYFTWNLNTFPNPLGMQDKLKSAGRRLVVIIDPHIKVEDGYYVYEQGRDNRYFVKNPNGTDFEGVCWPGQSTWIDFTNPAANQWYSDLYTTFEGISDNVHIWNDMNEPAVFEATEYENSMNPDLIHHEGFQHRDLHNAYGFYHTKGTYEGLLKTFPNRRNFILTRAHFVGSQRYTAMWTGDNVASWEHLRISIPICLTESLAGISFCGADVGGFLGSVTHELFQRWYQLGAWLPFYRSHTAREVERREPYLYPEDVQARFRNAIRQRYHHIPYWYTLWFEHTINKDPVMRPLSYNYPTDSAVLSIDWQFMIGSDILINPILDEGVTERNNYFPGGSNQVWYDIANNLMYPGGTHSYPVDMDSVPVFYRGGSIVPMKSINRPSTEQTQNDPYVLYVFLDRSNQARGNLYLDDGSTFDYQNKEYLYLQYTHIDNRLEWEKIHTDADYDGEWIVGHVVLYRPPGIFERTTRAKFVSGDKHHPVDVTYSKDGFSMTVSGFEADIRKAGYIKFY